MSKWIAEDSKEHWVTHLWDDATTPHDDPVRTHSYKKEAIPVKGDVTFIKDDSLDYIVVERAVHGNIRETRSGPGPGYPHGSYPGSSHCYYSGALADSCITGSTEELLDVARTIRSETSNEGGFADYKRIAAFVKDGSVFLWNPKSSQQVAEITLEAGKRFADLIIERLAPCTSKTSG